MSLKKKKVPNRLCVGCQQVKPKKELVRIVKNKSEEVFVDKTGKKPGRGVYICPDIECLAKARKYKRMEKSLGTGIDDVLYKQLEEELVNGEE